MIDEVRAKMTFQICFYNLKEKFVCICSNITLLSQTQWQRTGRGKENCIIQIQRRVCLWQINTPCLFLRRSMPNGLVQQSEKAPTDLMVENRCENNIETFIWYWDNWLIHKINTNLTRYRRQLFNRLSAIQRIKILIKWVNMVDMLVPKKNFLCLSNLYRLPK